MIDSLSRYPRGSNFVNIDHVCERPLRTATISSDGRCYVCICEAWLPISVGNIDSFQSLEEIWNTPIAQELQKDIADKKYTHCAVAHCGIINNDILHPTYRLSVGLDDSCNLACPSCRREMINITNGPLYEQRLARVKHFLRLLKYFDQAITVIMIGSGDPLASAIMRPILMEWQPKLNQNIVLFTNGLLMKKLLPQSKLFSHIHEFQISVDAGSQQVYEKVRRPGKFDVLRENLDWLASNRPQNSKVILKYTISAANASDVENFSAMCDHYGFHGEITKLDDWGTFDDFDSQEVIDNSDHELHPVAIKQLQSVSKKHNIWLSPYFSKFI